ncbi:DUF6640 family protein [Sphingorhabdus sp.]|jgi:hypothetical protein|uniref:DUF6640 family protein n=1 Tax=Sphingorhabdus sp. TaxID=1902408 RepID=UPI00405429D5
MELAAKLLISLVAFMTAVGPIKADFNATHATNPLWTPHARFHVVWQVLCQTGVAMFILYIVWGADFPGHVFLAAMMNFNWLVTFFLTLANMKRFEGSLKDVNGIPPFRFNIGGKVRLVDTNLFGATMLATINMIATILVLQ